MSNGIITSKNTSVNTTKIPYIYNHLDFEKMRETFKRIMIFDYGCGRETNHIHTFFTERGIIYFGYDPYWGPITDVKLFEKTISEVYNNRPAMPIIICSNVLNVISDWGKVKKIKKDILSHYAPYFFKVYEGDRTGIGSESKKDCWQWNKPTKDYITPWKNETVKKKIITHRLYTRFII